jgi:hypothetical protein
MYKLRLRLDTVLWTLAFALVIGLATYAASIFH